MFWTKKPKESVDLGMGTMESRTKDGKVYGRTLHGRWDMFGFTNPKPYVFRVERVFRQIMREDFKMKKMFQVTETLWIPAETIASVELVAVGVFLSEK